MIAGHGSRARPGGTDDPVASQGLRFVERGIGLEQEAPKVSGIRWKSGDTDADRHGTCQSRGGAVGDGEANALRQGQGAWRRFRAEQRELFPAITEELVALALGGGDRGGHLADHLIALHMAVPVVDRLEVVDIDHHQADRQVCLAGGLEHGHAFAIELPAILQAGQCVLADLLGQFLIAMPVGQVIEDVGHAMGRGLRGVTLQEPQIGGEHEAEEARRPDLGDPAAVEGQGRHAGENVQAGKEEQLVETQNDCQADEDPAWNGVRQQSAEPLIDDDEDHEVCEQQDRAPDHQQAHLVDEAQIGVVAGQARRVAVEAQDEPERDHQNIAAQQAIDRLAHHLGVFLDVEQQEEGELAREHHRGAGGNQSEGQIDEEDRRQIGLQEMHGAEQAVEDADADRLPLEEDCAHDDGIDNCLREQGDKT